MNGHGAQAGLGLDRGSFSFLGDVQEGARLGLLNVSDPELAQLAYAGTCEQAKERNPVSGGACGLGVLRQLMGSEERQFKEGSELVALPRHAPVFGLVRYVQALPRVAGDDLQVTTGVLQQ